MTAAEVIGRFVEIRGKYAQWVSALCPFHGDERASLSVSLSNGFFFCRACNKTGPFSEIIRKTGTPAQIARIADFKIPVKSYVYKDEAGRPLYAVIRYFPKDFTQMRIEGDRLISKLGDVRRVLYRTERIAQVAPGSTIWLVEGEKDVETLEEAGELATTNVGGAGSWRPEFAEALRGMLVRVVSDPDEAGQRRDRKIAASMPWAMIGTLPERSPGRAWKDITDFLSAGYLPGQIAFKSARSFLNEGKGRMVETGTCLVKQKKKFPPQIKTGVPMIDSILAVRQSWATFIGGYPGMGKTVLIAQMVRGLIRKHKVLVLPLEEKTDIFQRRMLLQDGLIRRIDSDIPEGLACSPDYDNLIYLKNFESVPFDIERLAPLIEETIQVEGIEVVVIDHLQELETQDEVGGHRSMVKICKAIRQIRNKFGVTMLIASQLRLLDQGGAKRDSDNLPEPTYMDLKESRKLSEIAVSILIVHRKRGQTILKCDKNRYGPRSRDRVKLNTGRLVFEEDDA